jgi:hypothetical protein
MTLQVVARKIYMLLEIMLDFCTVASVALSPMSANGETCMGHSQHAHIRATGNKASKLSKQFKDAVLDLVAVLSSPEIKVVAGARAVWLLETMNFSGFYDKAILSC